MIKSLNLSVDLDSMEDRNNSVFLMMKKMKKKYPMKIIWN